jgi:hypothetical protein
MNVIDPATEQHCIPFRAKKKKFEQHCKRDSI